MAGNDFLRGRILKICIIIILVTILLEDIAGAGIQIDTCITISSPGEYVLNTSINKSSAISCINILSSDVILDGAGHTINGIGDTDSVGVYMVSPDDTKGLINVSVMNLKLTDWGIGILSFGYWSSPHGNRYGNISNNTINTDFGIQIYYSGNYNIENNSAGMNLYKSSGNLITGNNATSKGGIHIGYSLNNILTKNDVSSNEYGIYMSYAEGNIIANNRIIGSTQTGVLLSEPWPSNNSIINNYISSNRCGIGIAGGGTNNTIAGNIVLLNSNCGADISSSGNLIYNNYFNNSRNIISSGNNTWNTTKTTGTNIINGSHIGGNYWARPDRVGFGQTCPDENEDGLCDSRYKLSNNNIDYLPLTKKKEKPVSPVPESGTLILTCAGIFGLFLILHRDRRHTF